MSKPKKILIHAGFHKAGSTSLQHSLDAALQGSSGKVLYWGPNTLQPFVVAGRAYSKGSNQTRLQEHRAAMDELAQKVKSRDEPFIILSNEDFLGKLPVGTHEKHYATAGDLLCEMFASLRTAMPDAQIDLLLITRELHSWLPSLYWQLVRHGEEARKESCFIDAMTLHPSLVDIAMQLVDVAGPDHALIRPLESFADTTLGPADAVLDWLQMPSDLKEALKPRKRSLSNTRPSAEIVEAFRQINEAKLSRDEQIIRRMKLNAISNIRKTRRRKCALLPNFEAVRVIIQLGPLDWSVAEPPRAAGQAVAVPQSDNVVLATASAFTRSTTCWAMGKRGPLAWAYDWRYRLVLRKELTRFDDKGVLLIASPNLTHELPGLEHQMDFMRALSAMVAECEHRFGMSVDGHFVSRGPTHDESMSSFTAIVKMAVPHWPLHIIDATESEQNPLCVQLRQAWEPGQMPRGLHKGEARH